MRWQNGVFDSNVIISNTQNKTPVKKKLLTEFVQELDITEPTGADVDEELVQLMEGLLKEKLQEDKTQSRVDKYPRPGNVIGLPTPRVNPLIWNQIPAQVRTSDSKSQKTQNACTGCIYRCYDESNELSDRTR